MLDHLSRIYCNGWWLGLAFAWNKSSPHRKSPRWDRRFVLVRSRRIWFNYPKVVICVVCRIRFENWPKLRICIVWWNFSPVGVGKNVTGNLHNGDANACVLCIHLSPWQCQHIVVVWIVNVSAFLWIKFLSVFGVYGRPAVQTVVIWSMCQF